jgi:hypothetical protein
VGDYVYVVVLLRRPFGFLPSPWGPLEDDDEPLTILGGRQGKSNGTQMDREIGFWAKFNEGRELPKGEF